jgi:hypothetical protein
METHFEIVERVVNRYEVIYNEEKLKEAGYKSIAEYCEKNKQTPFEIEGDDDGIIERIDYCEIINYVDELRPLIPEDIYWEED